MMIFDPITVIVCAAVLLLAIVTPLFNVFFRKQKTAKEPVSEDNQPKISVLLTPHEEARELEKNLPAYLNQDYEAGYEVIVVAEKGDSETEDILKRYASNPHLYATFIPETSRYMSRKKLSVTLGVKAAKNEWVIMTEPSMKPDTDKWLKTMAAHCRDGVNLVLGYTQYDEETPSYYRFERFHTACYLMRKGWKGTAYRTNMSHVAFRKSEFLEKNGYQGNLKYIRGEYDFLVNKYAKKGKTIVETSPEAWLTESCPSRKTWFNKHMYYQETRKHLSRSIPFRFVYNFDQMALHLNYLAMILALAYSIFFQNWIIVVASVLALIITVAQRIVYARKAFRNFNINIPVWKAIPYEIRLLWSHLHFRQKYVKADKYDFISHKI